MWHHVLTGAITTTAHAQDFRDSDGDRITGRRTVPLLIGGENAGLPWQLGIIGWTALSCWFWDVGSLACFSVILSRPRYWLVTQPNQVVFSAGSAVVLLYVDVSSKLFSFPFLFFILFLFYFCLFLPSFLFHYFFPAPLPAPKSNKGAYDCLIDSDFDVLAKLY